MEHDARNEEVEARLLIACACELAEGIQWRPDLERLFWTDIHGQSLWSADAEGGDIECWALPERLGSFAFDPDGAILAAMETGLFRISADIARIERLTRFEADKPSTRMNDGRCDRQGRFVVGGIEEQGLKPHSSVVRFDGATTESLIEEVGCANAICFSPDGDRMYFADTPTRRILRYPYAAESGALGAPEVFVECAEGEGFPDGACVDADGALWSARYAGAAVRRYLPDGTPDLTVRLPAPNVTCCCFGGAGLDRLFITTARENMSPDALADAPSAGGIFVADVAARGLEETRFAGRLFS